jgi:hypothetical protein
LKTKKIYDLEVINDIEEAIEAVQVVENMVPATEEDQHQIQQQLL